MPTASPSPTASFTDRYLLRPESSAPLGLFRIVFGILVAGELLYYWLARPFMEVYYFEPEFHFAYPGWPHLPFVNGLAMKVYVGLLILAFLLLAAGWYYKIVKWLCCLGFAYLFFLERAAFLNHWYLTLLICVLLLWIPAHVRFSLDVRAGRMEIRTVVPAWMRGSILLLVGMVYFFSGLAKLNADWLSGRTMDLVWQVIEGGITRVPDPGPREIWSAWGIVLLEICAAPALFIRPTRLPAIILLLAFHLGNLFFFTIGFFPVVMIVLTLLFVPFSRRANTASEIVLPRPHLSFLLILFFLLQLTLPLRHHFYAHNTLWTEDERLFSWDMFVAFKGGEARFRTIQPGQEASQMVNDADFGVTWGQTNKIFKSPDLILQYAHYLSSRSGDGQLQPRVYADVVSGLNGRPQQQFVPPNLDLSQQPRRTWSTYPWVTPVLQP